MPGTDTRSRAGAGIVSPDVNLQAIVFDFDGTLVESIDTKTEAFRVLFADHPEHVDRIVALHLEQGGRSRYEKFAMIYRDVLRREPQPGEFDRLGKRFEALVFDAVVKCPFVPGAVVRSSTSSDRAGHGSRLGNTPRGAAPDSRPAQAASEVCRGPRVAAE